MPWTTISCALLAWALTLLGVALGAALLGYLRTAAATMEIGSKLCATAITMFAIVTVLSAWHRLSATRDTASKRASSAGSRNDRLGGRVRPELARRRHAEHFGQFHSGAIDTALDGANRAARDVGRFLIGEARCSDQNQGLALVRRQLVEG
jgi:hypothetical protein